MKEMRRQGELIIKPCEKIKGKKLDHLILAEGEQTGHKHSISHGKAEIYEEDGTLYLRVISDMAELTHPDHKTLTIPKGNYEIVKQREYQVGEEKYREVRD